MTVVSFGETTGEAVEQAAFGAIWRAIKAGRMSSDRTNIGGFAIDPAEPMFRVFPTEPSDTAETAVLAIKLAALEAEMKGLKDLLAKVKSNLRQDRDGWRSGELRSWWRWLVG